MKYPSKKSRQFFLLTCAASFIAGCCAHYVGYRPPLITGHAMTIAANSTQLVGDFPMNLIPTPDGRFVISSDIGNHQSLWCIDTSTGRGVSHVDFRNSDTEKKKPELTGEAAPKISAPASLVSVGLYYGLAIDNAGTLYAAQGNHDTIAVLHLDHDGQLTLTGSIQARKNDFPTGLALDDHNHLYVADNAAGGDDPYSMHSGITIYDTTTNKELARYTFHSYYHTSNFPYGIAALPDGSKCFVASERDDAVYVLNTSDPAHPALAAKLATGAHPAAMLLSHDASTLFASNNLGDTVSIIDTQSCKIIDTIMLRPAMVRDIPGVSPLGLALSPDGKKLYVALADMDSIGVIDLKQHKLAGYIPAGWYPSSLATDATGKHLLIANARGTHLRNPDNHKDPLEPARKNVSTLSVLDGNVASVSIPTGGKLAKATEQVLRNNRLDHFAQEQKNPLAGISLSAGKITHVFYIIKENRTYDQVLGDEKDGNGDPSLVMFGRDVTPNLHALAERFVLLDNLYACGEVSGDGWTWSTQGMADAYVSRNVPYSYSRRGRRFDYEGMNNAYPTGGAPAEMNGKPLARAPFPSNGIPPIPNVAGTGRYIWQAAKDAGIPYRNYGFFLYFSDGKTGIAAGPDNYPCAQGLQPAGHDLAGITDFDFRRFDLHYPDSDAPMIYYQKTHDKKCLFAQNSYGIHQSNCRFAEWHHEFEEMLQKDPTGNSIPALTMLRMMTDHTEAATSGSHSPRSYVADNDYGIGEIVDCISHSPIWTHSAIFVIEDDAQNGSDHVDCHRTTAYVISPYIKAHSVDHHFYNTDSMLKTIELLAGLKPLCQFDAVADPIINWDTHPSNAAPYVAALPAKEIIAERNPEASKLRKRDPRRKMAESSDKMDFSHADAAPADEVNKIVWQTVKGATSKKPAPRGVVVDDDD